jgi:hypothetical protein
MAGNKFPVLVYSLHFSFKAIEILFDDFIAVERLFQAIVSKCLQILVMKKFNCTNFNPFKMLIHFGQYFFFETKSFR